MAADMDDSQTQAQFSFADLVSPSWFREREKSSIWIRSYNALHVDPGTVVTIPKFDLGDVRALLFRGTFQYSRATAPEIAFEGRQPSFRISFDTLQAPTADYLVLITPYAVDGAAGNEPAAKLRIDTAVGILGATFGRNLIYRPFHEASFHFGDGKISATSPGFENPDWFPPVIPNPQRITVAEGIATALHALAEADRNRVALSIRWFERSLYEGSIDSFLQAWIALETLAMPSTSNIKPLVHLLASGYGITDTDAGTRFSIGRIYGLRSRIVHDGHVVPYHGMLARYMEALYVDALHAALGMPLEGRIEAVLAIPDFDLPAYLHEPKRP